MKTRKYNWKVISMWLILIICILIIWIINPKAVDTNGNKSADLHTAVLHICANGFTEMEGR